MKKDYMDNGDKLFVDNITIKIKIEMIATAATGIEYGQDMDFTETMETLEYCVPKVKQKLYSRRQLVT